MIRQYPPQRLFEPAGLTQSAIASTPTNPYFEDISAGALQASVQSNYEFDKDVLEQMRLLEESVKASLNLPPDDLYQHDPSRLI